jgi:MFS family permease
VSASAHRTRSASSLAILVAASAAQVSVSLINYGLPSIGPDLRRTFGLSLPELGAVLTAGLLGSGLALVAAGIAVDRFGTRVSMLSAVALSSGGLVAAGLAHSKWVLFAGLIVFGLGTSVVPVAGAGELLRAYPVERRGWALGIRQMAVPLGGIISAVAFPVLRAAGGVRLPILVAAVLVGVSGIAFGVLAGPPHKAERGGTQRAAFGTILRAPGMLRLLAVAALYIVVLQSLLTFAVPTARDAGLSVFWAGAAYFVLNVAAATSRVVWGMVADRGGGTRRARTLTDIGMVAAVGAGLFAAALHVGTALVIVAVAVFAFGALGWNGVLYVAAAERVGIEYAGRAMGVASTVVFGLSFAAMPPMGALAHHFGWDALWISAVAIAAAGALVARGLDRPRVGPAPEPVR